MTLVTLRSRRLRGDRTGSSRMGTWVLGRGFNTFLGNVLHTANWPSDARICIMLQAGLRRRAGRLSILGQDRKDHHHELRPEDRLPAHRRAGGLARLFCNLFETGSASEWLLISSRRSRRGNPSRTSGSPLR